MDEATHGISIFGKPWWESLDPVAIPRMGNPGFLCDNSERMVDEILKVYATGCRKKDSRIGRNFGIQHAAKNLLEVSRFLINGSLAFRPGRFAGNLGNDLQIILTVQILGIFAK